ncbi:hypothetical protein ACM1RC_14560 [Paenibacillus azoreducens]
MKELISAVFLLALFIFPMSVFADSASSEASLENDQASKSLPGRLL